MRGDMQKDKDKKMRIEQAAREARGVSGAPPPVPTESCHDIDVLVSEQGVVTFSWNTKEIQEVARLLGTPELDPPRWCG